MLSFKINWLNVAKGVLLGCLILPWIVMIPAPQATDQAQLDRGAWEDEDIALQILVHAAMHDFPPCFGHFHIRGWVACNGETNELELLMREVP